VVSIACLLRGRVKGFIYRHSAHELSRGERVKGEGKGRTKDSGV